MNNMEYAILTVEQTRLWDQYTMRHQRISSLELMENAADACSQWLDRNYDIGKYSFSVFCAKGNNGGDGLAIARMLADMGCNVVVHILEFGTHGTEDFQSNLSLLHQLPVKISFIQEEKHIHPFVDNNIIVDAIFGSGLSRPPEGISQKLIDHINNSGKEIISIDIPSGMYADSSSVSHHKIIATHTLSFQAYKPAFLMAENAPYAGNVHIMDIELEHSFLSTIFPAFEFSNSLLVKNIYKPRNKFTNKGTYGHAALIVGSQNMMGAAVLAARACMRSGAGKLTCYVPGIGYQIMQLAVPEAMTMVSTEMEFITPPILDGTYKSVGIGPGIGQYKTHTQLLEAVFNVGKPAVIDADALNTLATAGVAMLKKIPALSILTPHPKEFDRLFGESANDFDRLNKARQKSAELNVIILLKGYLSVITMPGGKVYFNTSGNPGMATAGSGDVLTGIITGLLAQNYTPEESVIMGAYLHGLAGDLAAGILSEEALIASDLVDCLPAAFRQLYKIS